MKILDVLLALLYVLQSSDGFNLDQKNLVVEFKIPEKDALFGYSVAMRQTVNSELVVGAPLYNNKEGAIYSCTIANSSCNMLKDYSDFSVSSAQQRSQEFMGAALTSSGEDVMAAAPRWWINYIGSNYYRGRVVSFKSDNSINFDRVPCENERYGNLAFGYCEAGMSASSTKLKKLNGLPLFVVGAPGSLNYQGVLFTVFKSGGAVRYARTQEDRLTINSYMGYSVTTGKFSNANEANYMTDIAGGAPRGSEMQGKVIIYKVLTSYRISTILSIESPHDQVGSYFGASVAAIDLNNDGKDDLLVGSPLYSKIQDEGRVYIYMNRPGTSFNGFDQTLFLEGDEQGARFGSSIANIGDINNDGFQDVAIGAPYGGADGNGVVYIYNGGQSGLKSSSPQKILASSMPTPGKGFGVSIAGGVDVDSNGYPDLAIGAFTGSNAFIVKSKPVIKLTSKLHTNVKAVPSGLNAQFKCAKPELKDYNCITLMIDLSYTGLSTPSSITIETTIELDKSKIKKRAITTDGTKSPVIENIVLTKDQPKQFPLQLAISRDDDVISPIEFSASYRMLAQADCQGKPCAVLDQFSDYTDNHQITYLIACKSETTCKPNLDVNMTKIDLPKNRDLKPKEVLYGVVNQIHVLIDVKNTGEAAYQAIMKLNFSSEIQFNEVQINSIHVPTKKIELNQDTHQLQFPIGNPISNDSALVSVLVKFSVGASQPKQSQYTFSAEASAFGEDTDMKNNRDAKSINVKIETCVGAVSNARPSQVQYRLNAPVPPPPSSNGTLRNESVKVDVIGSEVIYTFYVRNQGKLPVDKLTAAINVVMQKSDLDFIYVVYLSVDGIACKADFNPKNYTSDYEKNPIISGNPGKERKRRDTQQADDQGVDKSRIITCFRQGDCKLYSCDIDRIEPNKGSVITMVTRLWDHNLPAINPYGVETTFKVEFSGRNKHLYKQREECKMSTDISILLRRGVEEKEAEPIAWWIFLVAVLGALLLLALVVAILYKVGFFKRNRKIKEITGPTDGGNEAHNPNAEDDDEDDD